MRWSRSALMSLGMLLSAWPLLAAEEMVQCSNGKGDPHLFRAQECQSLVDPTIPAGKQFPESSHDSDPLLDGLPNRGTGKDQGGGRWGGRSAGPDSDKRGTVAKTPGPWLVTEILVPAKGEAAKDYPSSALINGQRYRIGDLVDGGVVKKIDRDQVVLRHENKETVVPFDKTTHPVLTERVGIIPLKRHARGVYLIKVRVNHNQEFEAVLDTSATNLSLPEEVVTWLVRSGSLRQEHQIGKGKAKNVDGNEHETRRFRIASLKVGDLELKGIEADELPTKKEQATGTKQGSDSNGESEKSGKDDNDTVFDPEALTHPRFGIKVLERLGRWRIDHRSGLLIVER
ncbi:MAG: retroviral-like aspartic protease family protein [Magnetococcus sp. YQC-9]